MKVHFFAQFPDSPEWKYMPPAVVYFLVFTFFPGIHTGDLILEHLGAGNELELPDQTLLRFLILE